MKKVKAKLTLLFDEHSGLTIELADAYSGLRIADVFVEECSDVVALLSRRACVSCSAEVNNSEEIGLVAEHSSFTFEMSEDATYKTQDAIARKLAVTECPKGWTPRPYFGSQKSFFTEDGKSYARCHMVRYHDPESEEAKKLLKDRFSYD